MPLTVDLPIPGGDPGVWDDKLNAAIAAIVTFVNAIDSAGSGIATYADLPAQTVVGVTWTGTEPARPTARADLIVRWRGPAVPANALDGDEFVLTT